MAPEQAKEPESKKPKDTDLVLFGKQEIANLPPNVKALMGKYKTREIPGIAPTWKVDRPGDTLAGICVRYREGVKTQYGPADLVIMEGDYGFKSVWLGADLSRKLSAESVGRPMVIIYEGEQQIGNRPTKMKLFRVIEVLEPEEPHRT